MEKSDDEVDILMQIHSSKCKSISVKSWLYAAICIGLSDYGSGP